MAKKLQSEDLQRLRHRRSRGPQSTGFGTIDRLADLSKKTKERLASLGCESFQAAEFSGPQVADVAGDRERGLHFGK
jgi:hypothetical protein